jgi:DUF1009 family protein
MKGWKKLALVSGGGELPVLLAEHLAASGQPYWVAAVAPYADERLAGHPGAAFNLGHVGSRIEGMRAAGCDTVVLIGIVRRPDFATIELDAHGQALIPKVIAAAREGDDALLRVLIADLEEAGFKVIGVEEAFSDLLAPAGVLGAYAPSAASRADMRKAASVADALNTWDVGQAIAVCNGLVLAVEAQEGTDEMLARVARLRPEIRGNRESPRGVLLKRPKPGQERRIDLPTIGVRTIEGAAEAGLAGVAVEAGGALIVKREDVVRRADALGLFVCGFTTEEAAAG